jgi:hypothetical protein
MPTVTIFFLVLYTCIYMYPLFVVYSHSPGSIYVIGLCKLLYLSLSVTFISPINKPVNFTIIIDSRGTWSGFVCKYRWNHHTSWTPKLYYGRTVYMLCEALYGPPHFSLHVCPAGCSPPFLYIKSTCELHLAQDRGIVEAPGSFPLFSTW